MNFGFSEEQDLLRREVRRFLDERCPMQEVRRIMETAPGFCDTLWSEVAKLGWLGLVIPETYGGSGLSWLDLVVLLEETGRSLFPSPLISNTLAATAILEAGSEAQRQCWLPSLVNGSQRGTLAMLGEGEVLDTSDTAVRGKPDGAGFVLTGETRFVPDPEAANLFVVSFRCGERPEELGLAVIEAAHEGVTARSFPLIDETKRLGNLTLDGVQASADRLLGRPGEAAPGIARLLDLGAIAVTAEMAGAVAEALRLTVDYAKDRIQFGSPIGRFQSVKHPLAEIHLDLESFKSLLYYAAWTVTHRPEQLSRFASLAKAYATDTFVRAGVDSIQLHGAVGFTVEQDIHLYFKRSKWARPMFGDASTHYERAFALRGL